MAFSCLTGASPICKAPVAGYRLRGKKINRNPKSSKKKKKKILLARFTAFPKFFLLIVVKSFCVKASASIKSSYMLQSHVFPFKLRFAECQPLDIINSKFVVSCCSLEPELGAGIAENPGHRGDPRLAGARGEPRQPRCPRRGFLFSSAKCKTPHFIGSLGCKSSDDLFYRGAISSHFFV